MNLNKKKLAYTNKSIVKQKYTQHVVARITKGLMNYASLKLFSAKKWFVLRSLWAGD